MKKIRGIMIGAGAIGAMVAPIGVAISCGSVISGGSIEYKDPFQSEKMSNLYKKGALDINHSGISIKSLVDISTAITSPKNISYEEFNKQLDALSLTPDGITIQRSLFEKMQSNLMNRKVIGFLKDNAYQHNDQYRFMLLLDGKKLPQDTSVSWGSDLLTTLYGRTINNADSWDVAKSSAQVGAYLSFVFNTPASSTLVHENILSRLSFGRVIDGAPDAQSINFGDTRDAWLLKINPNKKPGELDNLQKDSLDRNIYGGVAWSSLDARNLVDEDLQGNPVPTSEYSNYSGTQYDGLFIKNN